MVSKTNSRVEDFEVEGTLNVKCLHSKAFGKFGSKSFAERHKRQQLSN